MRSEKDRDLERLIPVGTLALEINGSKSSSPSESPSASSSLSHSSGKEVALSLSSHPFEHIINIRSGFRI